MGFLRGFMGLAVFPWLHLARGWDWAWASAAKTSRWLLLRWHVSTTTIDAGRSSRRAFKDEFLFLIKKFTQNFDSFSFYSHFLIFTGWLDSKIVSPQNYVLAPFVNWHFLYQGRIIAHSLILLRIASLWRSHFFCFSFSNHRKQSKKTKIIFHIFSLCFIVIINNIEKKIKFFVLFSSKNHVLISNWWIRPRVVYISCILTLNQYRNIYHNFALRNARAGWNGTRRTSILR